MKKFFTTKSKIEQLPEQVTLAELEDKIREIIEHLNK